MGRRLAPPGGSRGGRAADGGAEAGGTSLAGGLRRQGSLRHLQGGVPSAMGCAPGAAGKTRTAPAHSFEGPGGRAAVLPHRSVGRTGRIGSRSLCVMSTKKENDNVCCR